MRPHPHLAWLAALPLAAILAVIIVVSLQWRAPESTTTAAAGPEPERVPDYFVREADIRSFSAEGDLMHRLRAVSVAHYPDESATLENINITRLPGPWTLNAAQGLAPAGLQELVLQGDVRIHTNLEDGSPAELRTETLQLRFQERLMESLAPVELHSKQSQARANSFRADLGDYDIELIGEVQVEHKP